jgi:hypothetical protein
MLFACSLSAIARYLDISSRLTGKGTETRHPIAAFTNSITDSHMTMDHFLREGFIDIDLIRIRSSRTKQRHGRQLTVFICALAFLKSHNLFDLTKETFRPRNDHGCPVLEK